MNTPLDLTLFGFTQTENIVYSRLLAGGPAGGYAVARDVNLARANIYPALRGLVAKGAAVVMGENPQRFRAIKPADLYARILDEETQKLEQLEAQIASVPDQGAPTFVPITGERAFLSLAGRAVVRERGELTLVGPVGILSPLLPTLRKRIADGGAANIWILGESAEFPIAISGTIPQERAALTFQSPVTVLVLEQAALAARILPQGLSGYWTSDPTVLGATRACMLALTSGAR